MHKGTSRRWRILLPLLLIAAPGVLVYANTFSVPFLFDGEEAIAKNDSIRHLWPIWKTMSPPRETTVAGRPVANLTFAINFQLSGLAVWSYHVFNLVIHVLAGLVLFGIVRRTLQTEAFRESLSPVSSALALCVALIWVVHPLQTESVTYTVQRVESLMGLFYLLTLYCAIRAFASGRRPWFVGAVGFCALGMATKEVMVSAPLVVLLYDRVFVSASFREIFRRRWKLYAALAMTWMILLALVAAGPRPQSAGFGFEDLTPFEYAKAQGPVVLYYLRLVFWPHPLVIDYGLEVPQTVFGVYPSILVIAGLLAGTALALVCRPRLGFLGAWFFLILGPSSSVLPLWVEIAAEHRMYLSLSAVAVLVVVGGYRAGAFLLRRVVADDSVRRKLGTAIGGGLALLIVVSLGYRTCQRNKDYQSAVSFWTETLKYAPNNPRAYNNLGVALVNQKRYDEAVTRYREALRLSSRCYPCHRNLGIALTLLGRHQEAAESFSNVLKHKPDDAPAHHLMGFALLELGRTDEALDHFRGAVRLQPHDGKMRQRFAAVLAGQGKIEEAMLHYREAMRLRPDWPEPPNSLAWLLATHPEVRFRDGHEAVPLAKKACELTDYEAFWTLDTLAAAYAEVGEFSKAVRTAQKALEIVSSQREDEVVEVIRRHLQLFRAGRPCRERPQQPKGFSQ